MFFLLFSSTTFLFSAWSLFDVEVVVEAVAEAVKESLRLFIKPKPLDESEVAPA